MSIHKKFNKIKREKLGGKLIAIQNLIRLHAENSIRTLLLLNLSEVKKHYPNLDFSELGYLTQKFGEDIKENKDLVKLLSEVFSTEGLDDPITKDEAKFVEFLKELQKLVTVDNIKKHLDNYDVKKENMDKLLGAVKMANTVEHGEEFEIVQ